MAVLHLLPSRLAIIVPPWEFGPALTSYRTHCRTSNFPQTTPIVGSRFSNRSHYNEFVENGVKSWVVMRRRLILGMKGTQNRAAQSSQGEGTLRLRTGMRQPPLDHAEPSLLFLGLPPFFFFAPLFGWSLLLFIPLFRSSSSYNCQSSMPILKCTSPQPFFLAFCELL